MFSGIIWHDPLRNEDIRDQYDVTPIVETLWEVPSLHVIHTVDTSLAKIDLNIHANDRRPKDRSDFT